MGRSLGSGKVFRVNQVARLGTFMLLSFRIRCKEKKKKKELGLALALSVITVCMLAEKSDHAF